MYSCECGYESTAKFNLKRHQQSKTHQLNMLCIGENLVADDNGLYMCNICNFQTCRKSNYRKHVLSEKHATTKAETVVVDKSLMDFSEGKIVVPSSASSTSSLVVSDDSIKPVMLLEVMEMFLTHQKHQQTEILKTFADRIMATSQNNNNLEQPPNANHSFISAGQCNIVGNTMTNTVNNKNYFIFKV